MNQKGFTLIELMFVMAVTAILMAIAVPSFSDLIARQRIASAASDFSTDLALARMEAMRRGGRATVCASTDGTTCAGGTAWRTGWIVFADTNGNGAHEAAEPLIKVRRLESATLQFTEAAGTGFAMFQSTGRLNAQLIWTICSTGRTGRVLNARITGAVTGYPTATVCP
ncbi:Tfp pilus assembly protein FimT/FimU [Niveibacterium umoris]|uniref:Type II secretion system protein H n=1 Tax=Niveibacterium umoris TaxID=1193620 RepID=A0A840BEX6_9RHOO|nr:type IV fimbrial biogenesis protein FimT [Niveibacterium umoris]